MQIKIQEKRWDKTKEREIWEWWEEQELYKCDMESKRVLVIDTPPPYPRF